MDRIVELFGQLQLELLPEEWVDSLLKDDFSTEIDFPYDYDVFLQESEIGQLMLEICKYIKEWLESETIDISIASTSTSSLNTSQVSCQSWQDLKSHNVHDKALISMLSILMLRGKTKRQLKHKRLGLIATDLYFMLIAIPGCEAFQIFNPILYSYAMENLKICSILKHPNTLAKAKSKPASKKRRGRSDDGSSEEEEEAEEEMANNEAFSNSEKSIVLKLLIDILNDLIFLFQRFPLKGQDDSLVITIQILILLSRVEKTSSSILTCTPSSKNLSHLAYKAYQTLFKLCSPNHGDVSEICRLILKEMMPAFLVFCSDGLQMPAKEALVIKDLSLQFVRNLLLNIKDPAFNSVLTLIQFVMAKIPDKADLRAKGAQIVLELMGVLPDSLYPRAVVLTLTFSLNEQVKFRVTALEIIAKLLYANEKPPPSPIRFSDPNNESRKSTSNRRESEEELVDADERPSLSEAYYSTHKFLLAAIFARCLDIASSVRSKALAILASLFSSNNKSIKEELESIFTTPYLIEANGEPNERGFCNFLQLLKNRKTAKNPPPNPLPDARIVIKMLEIYILDEKVFVRKAAFQVLSNIFMLNERWMTNKLLQTMVDNMRDVSVMVRKLLMQCLTELLLHFPSHPELPKFWVKSVMPLIMEDEVIAQQRVLEVVHKVVFDNLVPHRLMKSDLHALPWIVLDLIVLNSQQLFSKACEHWAKNETIKQNVITTIKTHIGTENNSAAWYLLASLSEFIKIKDPQFVLDYFYENVLNNQQVDEYCCQLVTEVIYTSYGQLPKISQVHLCESVLKHLSQFTVPLPMIARCVDVCNLVTMTHADPPEKGREDTKVWATVLIHACENRLEKVIGPNSPLVLEDDNRLCQYIFTLGEACQICPGIVKDSTVDLVENLLANSENYPEHDDAEFEGKFWRGKVSAAVQGLAVVTLGKLCMQTDGTAQILVPLLGSLLRYSPHAEIKINSMIALTDMCFKYTSMIEVYLPEMCICLKDKRLAVRENTLRLIMQMVQKDYLKMRCPMFFHILTLLLDEELVIRDLTTSFVIHSLLKKKNKLLGQHFIEALLHYSGHLQENATYGRVETTSDWERARELFSLKGPGNQEKRRTIYRFMLENMTDDQKFCVSYRVCKDVLSEVAEGNMKLSTSGTTVLQDALYVLSCNEIRLSQFKSGGKDDDENDIVVEEAQNQIKSLRKTLIDEIMKKNLAENIVPIFIKLKNTLLQIKSPMVRDVLTCLRELMKEYKQEIGTFLAADKVLLAEITHDMKTLETEEEERNSEALNESVNEVFKKVMRLSKSPRKSTSTRQSTSSLVSPASTSGTRSTRLSPKPSTQATTSNGCVIEKQASPSASEAMEEDGTPTIRSRQSRALTSGKQVSPALSSKSSCSTPEAMEEDPAPNMRSRQNRASTSSNTILESAEEGIPSTSSGAPNMRSRQNRASTSSNTVLESAEEGIPSTSSGSRARQSRVSSTSSNSEASTSQQTTNTRRNKKRN